MLLSGSDLGRVAMTNGRPISGRRGTADYTSYSLNPARLGGLDSCREDDGRDLRSRATAADGIRVV